MADLPGVHQRGTYVSLIFGLHRAGRTGVLEVRSGRYWRRLYFVSGQSVWYSSDRVEEELAHTLVKAGLVTAKRMQSVTAKSSPFEPISDRLLSGGLIKPKELQEHRFEQLGPAVAAALSWESGEWNFQPRDSLPLEALDPQLLPEANVLLGLWNGVRSHVQMEEALHGIGTATSTKLQPSSRLPEALDSLMLEEPLSGLGAAIGDGETVEELFRKIPDRSGQMMPLLWFLSNCGLLKDPAAGPDAVKELLSAGTDLGRAAQLQLGLQRVKEAKAAARAPRSGSAVASPARKKEAGAGRGRAPSRKQGTLPLDEPGKKPTARPAAAKASVAKPAAKKPTPASSPPPAASADSHLARLIRTAHSHRVGKNFYAFFDLDKSARSSDVVGAYERLTRSWEAAATDSSLGEEDHARVQELLHAAKLVWQTLSDRRRRADYDQRMKAGLAPLIESNLSLFMASTRARADQRELSTRSEPKEVSAAGAAHDEAQILMKRGNYAKAFSELQTLRAAHGSNPHVLADLGWCCWKVHRNSTPAGGDGENAEDLLLLAQTFDPAHAKAMEYLGRIARERGDAEGTALWTQRLLKAHPRDRWGLEMRSTLEEEGAMSGAVRGRGKRGR